MNKLTKGAIAGAAGIALLLGGAGSFALWNGTASASAGSIQSGSLSLTAATDGVWTNITGSTPATISNIGTFRIVPGDHLKFTQTLNIAGTGDDLAASLTSTLGSGTNAITGLNTGLTLAKGTDAGGILTVGSPATTVTISKAGTASVVATIDVNFPSGSTGGQASTADLSTVAFTLTQVAPTTGKGN